MSMATVPQCQIRDPQIFLQVSRVKMIYKRKLIPTWDRVDNNLASASKHMGFKRTKGQKRDIKGMRSQVGLALKPNRNPKP